jgi:hypothetical protein
MSWLCCVVLYAFLLVVPSLLACMHASSLTLPCIIYIIVCQLHGCGGFGTDTLERRWYITQYIHASIQAAQVTPIVTTAFWMATLQSLLVAMHSTQESWRFHDITTIVHCVFIQTLVKRPSLLWTGRRRDEE